MIKYYNVYIHVIQYYTKFIIMMYVVYIYIYIYNCI
jgi:hypothetical protein